jgi:hypothetical protein
MARGGHGLPNLLCPADRSSLKQLFQGWPAGRADGLQPSFTPLDTPLHTPMGGVEGHEVTDDKGRFHEDEE